MAGIKIPVIPDMSKFEKELKKPRKANILPSGVGAKSGINTTQFLGLEAFADKINVEQEKATTTSKTGFLGLNLTLGGLAKTLGIIGLGVMVLGAIFSGFMKMAQPIFDILKIIGMLLFIPLIPLLKPILKLMAGLIKVLLPVMNYLRAGIEKLVEWLGTGLEWVWDNLLKPIWEGIVTFGFWLGSVGKWIWENILKPAFMFLAPVGKFLFNLIINSFKVLWNIGKFLFNLIVGYFKILWNIGKFIFNLVVSYFKFLYKVGEWIWIKIIKPAFSYLNKVGEWIWNIIKTPFQWLANKIKSIGNWFRRGSTRTSGMMGLNVGDAILRPNGQVIQTNPRDTLIATKSPETLLGSGMTYAPTININASISSDLDIREIAEKIAEYSKEELSRRTGDFT